MEFIYWKWTKKEEVIKTKREREILVESTIEHAINTPNFDTTKNKREECSERISNRKWIIQRNINPYVNQNNYIDDLTAQNEFLRPKDSNDKKNISLS